MAKVDNEYLPLSVLGSFPDDWHEATLSDVCLQVTDGTHDSPKPVLEGGHPLVTGKAIKDRKIDFAVTYNISDSEHQKILVRSKAERDDILFANIGNSIGDLVRVQTDRSFSIKNVALFKPNQSIIYPRYLEYFLLSPQVQDFIKGSTRGSAQPFIGLGSLRGFPISTPPMDEQRNIGKLLGALDDRITLLRETNATLESIAQALFKSWFVDFDPVRAKQEGRVPDGMDEATAALFPDGFEESELGLVPRGWDIRKAESLLTRLSTKVRYTKEQVQSSGAIPVYEQGAGVLLGYHDGNAQFQATPNEPIFIFGDHTCVTHLSCEPFDISMNVIAIKGSNRPTLWTYYAIKDKQTFQEYRRHWMELAVKEIIVPPLEICDEFSRITSSIHLKIESNTRQVNILATLRDTLLPRLISGQLRLPEAKENFLKELI